MQKNLWICLILQKNRWLKYRFFALFRRVQQKAGARSAHAVKGRRAWRETRALAPAPSEKPVRSERHAKRRGGGAPLTESYFVSVDLLHKIFTTRKDELVKDLPAT